ncbi:hypothetical protein [Pseudonocardia parietis]|uniref:Anti-anti-sigma factor n=1 Tax=Pseudonocardia parietis TaxID=570936 RepID=A0ABS4W6W8_9PSEU|nr:hypothetical protein [Pseudonocardia parietis]MBP2371956.1 hypothetical protein [Pseudonocardia parietis]
MSRVKGDQPRAGVYRIRVDGVLDAEAGGHLLRLLDAHLHLLASGWAATRHVVVDLAGATTTPRGIRALQYARHAVEQRRGLGLHLVCTDHLGPRVTPGERAVLRRLRTYPDLDTALRALEPAADPSGARAETG